MYDEGLRLLKDGKTDETRKLMNDFLARYPGSNLAPGALFWIGESDYREGNYAQAILTFKEVTKRFPSHAKSADSLFKAGMAYEKLGDKPNAVAQYQAVARDFPASEVAASAKAKLKQLGK